MYKDFFFVLDVERERPVDCVLGKYLKEKKYSAAGALTKNIETTRVLITHM